MLLLKADLPLQMYSTSGKVENRSPEDALRFRSDFWWGESIIHSITYHESYRRPDFRIESGECGDRSCISAPDIAAMAEKVKVISVSDPSVSFFILGIMASHGLLTKSSERAYHGLKTLVPSRLIAVLMWRVDWGTVAAARSGWHI